MGSDFTVLPQIHLNYTKVEDSVEKNGYRHILPCNTVWETNVMLFSSTSLPWYLYTGVIMEEEEGFESIKPVPNWIETKCYSCLLK